MSDTVNIAGECDATVLARLAEHAAAREPVEIPDSTLVVLVTEAGQTIQEFDTEQYGTTPARKRGTAHVTDADSFCTYVDRHATQIGTTLWSDEKGGTVTAVIDDHEANGDVALGGEPGWGQHRARLTLRSTADWDHWLSLDGKYASQDTFAEHIEDGVDAIRTPDAATMLEIAQSFRASSGAHFDSTRRLSGELQFRYTEETTASAGVAGTMEIPETFTLGLAPFEGSDEYEITARFRYRLHDGNLLLGYRLIRPDAVRKTAFDDTIATIATGTGLPVMAGTPRQ